MVTELLNRSVTFLKNSFGLRIIMKRTYTPEMLTIQSRSPLCLKIPAWSFVRYIIVGKISNKKAILLLIVNVFLLAHKTWIYRAINLHAISQVSL